MADVRCPMCGKSNPAEAEACRFCQARLKPLNISPFGLGDDRDVPDWLRGLRGPDEPGDDDGGDVLKGAAGSDDSDIPDWLSRLGGQEREQPADQEEGAAAPEPTPSFGEAEKADETPDWLAGLTGDRQEQAFSFGEPEGEQAPDWGAQPAAEPAGETSDWFSSLTGDRQEQAFSFGEPEGAQAPDWGAQPAAEPAGETPDWLSGLTGASQEQSFSFGASEAAQAPDWGAEPAAEPAGETPDWLSSLPGASQQPFSFDDAEEPTLEPAGETPDWLSNLGGSQEASFAAPESAEPAAEPAGDLPDWLSSLTGASGPSDTPFTTPSASESDDSGDWLSQARTEPGWFSQDQAVSFTAETPAEPGQVPDWLSGEADASGPYGAKAEEPAFPGAAEPQPEDAQGLPAWLSNLDKTGQGAAYTSSVPAFTMDEGDEAYSQAEPAAEPAGMQMNMPDWISQVTADSIQDTPLPQAEAEMESSLAQADLPDWLEAMRPTASSVSSAAAAASGESFRDTSDDRLEQAGPLAGLRGVIPAEAGALQLRKPPAYSLKVSIPDEQQLRVQMLQELVAGEGKALPLPGKAAVSGQMVLRLLVFFLLVAASLIALMNDAVTPLPQANRAAAEVLAVKQQVDALAAGAPVLVAMDYEPGFADELNAIVLPVIDHLGAKNAYLTFASTSPAGPILAANLVDWLNHQPAFQQGGYTRYANLGFIPGGANGLLAFASAPAQTLPLRLDGYPAWTGQPLDANLGLASFGLVLLVTDDAETARAWIEQVAPLLQTTNTPLVVLASAQAGPMVQPYFDTAPRVVSGLLSGLAGGAAYQSLTGRAGTAPIYWDAFSLSLNTVVIFIALGGLFSLVMGSLPKRKPAKGEEKA